MIKKYKCDLNFKNRIEGIYFSQHKFDVCNYAFDIVSESIHIFSLKNIEN
jgi:hypothetical protein